MGVIVQHGVGDCAELLRISAVWHRAYADKHGHEYQPDMERRCPERRPYWEKIPLLLESMKTKPDGTLFAWLDADCLIVDPSVDLFYGFTGDIGLTTVKYPKQDEHFNSGVMLLRNGPSARGILEDAFTRWPNDVPNFVHPKHDERAINEAIAFFNPVVQVLPPEMNCWHNNFEKCCNVVIRAWHGTPNSTVRLRMQAELRRVRAENVAHSA